MCVFSPSLGATSWIKIISKKSIGKCFITYSDEILSLYFANDCLSRTTYTAFVSNIKHCIWYDSLLYDLFLSIAYREKKKVLKSNSGVSVIRIPIIRTLHLLNKLCLEQIFFNVLFYHHSVISWSECGRFCLQHFLNHYKCLNNPDNVIMAGWPVQWLSI